MLAACFMKQRCWTLTGLTSLNLSIFIVNNFWCVINCLNINGVTIYRAKISWHSDFKSFTDKLFLDNSEEKSKKQISNSENEAEEN